MTRARIIKQARPAPAPASQPATARLPWLTRAQMQAADTPVHMAPLPPAFTRLVHATQAAWQMISHRQPCQGVGHVIAMPGPKGWTQSEAAATSWRKRLALLLAIMTVPAMAAPADFSVFSGPQAAPAVPDPLALAAANALPFERPGMSFPGSAFYFLADPPSAALVALPAADPLKPGPEAGRQLGEFIHSGPAARPFFSAGSGTAHDRALSCLAQAVWYEAASESEAGQRAVAQVVLNRVAHPSWPASVCGVVYQGSDRYSGCQFTFTCDGSLARRPSGASWARAQRIAADALAGSVYAPVGHATHYHTLWVNPSWAGSLDHVGTIGAHRFYRNRGAGGTKSAFTMTYAAFEPAVSGRGGHDATALARSARPELASAALDNKAERAGLAKDRARHNDSRPASKTDSNSGLNRADDSLAEFATAGVVRPEFANAGRWKAGARPVAAESGTPSAAAQ